jgi:hypothetical protein
MAFVTQAAGGEAGNILVYAKILELLGEEPLEWPNRIYSPDDVSRASIPGFSSFSARSSLPMISL